jgi:MtN3 and saliva related transmembrane protein
MLPRPLVMMLNMATLVGLAAAGLTAFSNLPQVLKCWRTGQTDDLSLRMLLSLAAGTGLWIAYGFMRSDVVIVAANGISFALAGMLLLFKVRGLPGEAQKDR